MNEMTKEQDQALDALVQRKLAEKKAERESQMAAFMDASDYIYEKHHANYATQMAGKAIGGAADMAANVSRSEAGKMVYTDFVASEDEQMRLRAHDAYSKIDADFNDRMERHRNIIRYRSITNDSRPQLVDTTQKYRSQFKFDDYDKAVSEAERRNKESGVNTSGLEPDEWPVTPSDVMDEEFMDVVASREDPALAKRYKTLRDTSEGLRDKLRPEWVEKAETWSDAVPHSMVGQMFLDAAQNVSNLAVAGAGKAINVVTGTPSGSILAAGTLAMQEQGSFLQQVDPFVDAGMPVDLAEKYSLEYGALSGVVEYSEQAMNVATLGGSGWAAKAIGKKVAPKSIVGQFAKWAVGRGLDAVGEGGEEVVQEALQYYIAEKMLGEWAERSGKKDFAKEMEGMSLPMTKDGKVDWEAARGNLLRAFQSGVNVSLALGAVRAPVDVANADAALSDKIKVQSAGINWQLQQLSLLGEKLKVVNSEIQSDEVEAGQDVEAAAPTNGKRKTLTDEEVEGAITAMEPEQIAVLAAKEKLTRKDWKALGLPNMPEAERARFLEHVKNARTQETKEPGSLDVGPERDAEGVETGTRGAKAGAFTNRDGDAEVTVSMIVSENRDLPAGDAKILDEQFKGDRLTWVELANAKGLSSKTRTRLVSTLEASGSVEYGDPEYMATSDVKLSPDIMKAFRGLRLMNRNGQRGGMTANSMANAKIVIEAIAEAAWNAVPAGDKTLLDEAKYKEGVSFQAGMLLEMPDLYDADTGNFLTLKNDGFGLFIELGGVMNEAGEAAVAQLKSGGVSSADAGGARFSPAEGENAIAPPEDDGLTNRGAGVTITDQQGGGSNAGTTDTQTSQVGSKRIPQAVDRESRTDYGRKYADFLQRSVREHADWYAAFEKGEITREELKFREGEVLAQEAERNGDILPSSDFDRAHAELVKEAGRENAGGVENVNAFDIVDGVAYVIKRNNLSYSNSYSDFFNKVALHNYLFPDTAYEFLGFMYDNKVDRGPGYSVALQPVLRQRFVERSGKATNADIDEAMASIGFEKRSNGSFIDRNRGIFVSDLTDDNVLLDENGYVAVIDPVIETTERYRNGDTMYREAEPAPQEQKATRSVTEELANTSEEDLEAMMDQASAELAQEKEASSKPVETPEAPVKKPRNGKKAVPGGTVEATTPATATADAPKIGKKGIRNKADKEKAVLGKRYDKEVAKDAEALYDIFGASKDVASESSQFQDMPARQDDFDEAKYAKAAPFMRNILDNHEKNGKNLGDFVKSIMRDFGEGVRPYLRRFAQDVATERKARNEEGSRKGDAAGGRSPDIEGSERGSGEAGVTSGAGGAEERAVGPGGAGSDGGVPTRAGDDSGGREGDGVPEEPVGVGRQRTDRRAGGTPSGRTGERVASEDAGADSDGSGEASPVVLAPNGSLDLRNAAPVVLTKRQRLAVNARVEEITQKPVEDITDEDREVLRQYTGIGGLGSREAGAVDQFYTPYETIRAMYKALSDAGVKMENVLEPAAGSGSIVGHLPGANWTTVELDKKNYEVLRRLYPAAKHYNMSYEDVTLSGMDVVISNIPFMEDRGIRKRHTDIKTLHDFYFVQALEQVRPNGVVAFIAPTGVMDKIDDSVRRKIVEKGDIIGAFRLPEGHFAKSAHTDVSSDIIFVQRRPDGVPPRQANAEANERFVETVQNEEGARISAWYEASPESILGTLEPKTNRFGKNVLAVTGTADLSGVQLGYEPYGEAAKEEKAEGKVKGLRPSTQKEFETFAKENPDVLTATKLGSGDLYSENVRMKDGVVYMLDYEVPKFKDVPKDGGKVYRPMVGDDARKVAALLDILASANAFQNGDSAAGEAGIAKIAAYRDEFKKSPHKDRDFKRLLKNLGETRLFLELTSTFNENFEPAPVFTEKTKHADGGRYKATSEDDLITQARAAEDNKGQIFTRDEKVLFGKDDIPTLLEAGYSLVEVDSDGHVVLQNDVLYYSGNIYKKLSELSRLKESVRSKAYADAIERQRQRLEEVLPEKKYWENISIHGTEEWLTDILKEVGIYISSWTNSRGMYEYRLSGGNFDAKTHTILNRHLNGESLVEQQENEPTDVFRGRLMDAEETLRNGLLAIKNAVAAVPALVEKAEHEYATRFRNYVKPDYSKASYLLADVLKEIEENAPMVYNAKLKKKVPLQLRENQIRWITQALIEGKGINAHDVGGGKTMSAIVLARAMAMRGMAKKPLFVVPAKTIKKWARETSLLFPKAKIIDLGGLPKDKREKTLFEYAASNADYTFISHEGFGQLKLPSEVEAGYVQATINETMDDPEKSRFRNAAKAKKLSEQYVEELSSVTRDTRLTFDKLGVDCIIADEAHQFKNMGVSPSLSTSGLGKGITFKSKDAKKKKAGEESEEDAADGNEDGTVRLESASSYDFRFKSNWIAERNNGGNIFLLTATPTPNKPMELYTMLRHFGPGILDDAGIHSDRDFATAFFRMAERRDLEDKKKVVLSKIVNATDFRAILDRFVDKIAMENMPYIKVPQANHMQHFLDSSAEYEEIAEDLRERREKFENERGKRGEHDPDEKRDSIVAIFTGGRSASISPQLYGGEHAGVRIMERTHNPRSDKVEWVLQYATSVAKKNRNAGQLFFVDEIGSKRVEEGNMDRDLHQELKAEFISRGFKASEIAIINGKVVTNPKTGNDTKVSGKKAAERKAEVQDAYNEGKIKILLGSTKSMGEGMDLQVKTTDIYHLDIPYTPGEIRQRNGRGVRYGNENAEVNIHYLLTRGTFDSLSFDIQQRKKGWNEAIWDKDVAEEISTEEEMLEGSIPNEKQIAIELEKDPIKKQKLRAEFELQALRDKITEVQNAISAKHIARARHKESLEKDERMVDHWAETERNAKPKDSIKDEAERAKDYEDRVEYHRDMQKRAQARVEEAKAKIEKTSKEIEELGNRFSAAREEVIAFQKRFFDANNQFIPDMAKVAEQAKAEEEARAADEWMQEPQFLDMPARGSRASTRFERSSVESEGTAESEAPISRNDIVALMRKEFPGLAIRGRATWRRKTAAGWFDRANTLIRSNDSAALDVISHELGHYIDQVTSAMRRGVPGAVTQELNKMASALYKGKTPVGGLRAEGFAEFMRGWLTCSEEMSDVCPNTLTWFNSVWMPAHEATGMSLMKIQDAITRFRMQRPEDAVRAFYTHKDPSAIASKIAWIRSHLNYHTFVDKYHFLLDDMRAAGIDVDLHDKRLTKAQLAEAVQNNPYLKATLYEKAAGRKTVEMALRGTTNLIGNKSTGESLYAALEEVRKDQKKFKMFMDYAVARQAQEYHRRGLKSGLSEAEADRTVENLESALFVDTLERVKTWSRRILHLLVESGSMTQDEFDKIEAENPVYIKFLRRFDPAQVNKARVGGGKAVHRRKGGAQDIEDPIAAMLVDAQKIIQAAQQADIARCIVRATARAKKGSNVAENWIVPVPAPKKVTEFAADKIKKDIAKIAVGRMGVDEITAILSLDDFWSEKLTVFQNASEFNGKEKIVKVVINGEAAFFEVADDRLFELLKNQGKRVEDSEFKRLNNDVVNTIRLGATILNPRFGLLSNPLRDTVSAFMFSDYHTHIPVASLIHGVAKDLGNTDTSRIYHAMGLDLDTLSGRNLRAAKHLEKQVTAASDFQKQMKGGIVRGLSSIVSTPEVGPRIMEFEGAYREWLERTGDEDAAAIMAALASGDITVNFRRSGDNDVSEVVLFFNAGVQSIDKLLRELGAVQALPWEKQQSRGKRLARTVVRAGMALTAVSLASYARFRDEEWWKEMPAHEKWRYFHFGHPGKGLRIPLPFEPGMLFGALPVAILEEFRTPGSIAECLTTMLDSLPIQIGGFHDTLRNLTAVAPILDVVANKDWKGASLIPEHVKKTRKPVDWYTQNTGETAKFIGRLLWAGVEGTRFEEMAAPVYIEHLLNQYSGGMYKMISTGFEKGADPSIIGAGGDLSTLPVAGVLFMRKGTSRLSSDFYNRMHDLEQALGSRRITVEELGELRAKQAVAGDLSELFDARRLVKTDRTKRRGQIKIETDALIEDVHKKIREHNANTAAHRPLGVRSAVVMMTDPSASSEEREFSKRILEGVSMGEMQEQLRAYTLRQGGSVKTKYDNGKPTPYGLRLYRLKAYTQE